jgi:hypothetical protein
MIKLNIPALIVLITLTCGTGAFAQATQTSTAPVTNTLAAADVEVLKALDAKVMAATDAPDDAILNTVLAPDVLVVAPNGETGGKALVTKLIGIGLPNQYGADSVTVYPHGPDSAIVVSHLVRQRPSDLKDYNPMPHFLATHLYERRAGKWLLTYLQYCTVRDE